MLDDEDHIDLLDRRRLLQHLDKSLFKYKRVSRPTKVKTILKDTFRQTSSVAIALHVH